MGGSSEVIIIKVRVRVYNIFETVVGGDVSPDVGGFGVEEDVVALVEDAVVVVIGYFGGDRHEVVVDEVAGTGGEHFAGSGVEGDLATKGVVECREVVDCDFVDASFADGNFEPLTFGKEGVGCEVLREGHAGKEGHEKGAEEDLFCFCVKHASITDFVFFYCIGVKIMMA